MQRTMKHTIERTMQRTTQVTLFSMFCLFQKMNFSLLENIQIILNQKMVIVFQPVISYHYYSEEIGRIWKNNTLKVKK